MTSLDRDALFIDGGGTLSLLNNATLAPAPGVNTFTLNGGNLIMGSASLAALLAMEIDSGGKSDRIALNGGSVATTGAQTYGAALTLGAAGPSTTLTGTDFTFTATLTPEGVRAHHAARVNQSRCLRPAAGDAPRADIAASRGSRPHPPRRSQARRHRLDLGPPVDPGTLRDLPVGTADRHADRDRLHLRPAGRASERRGHPSVASRLSAGTRDREERSCFAAAGARAPCGPCGKASDLDAHGRRPPARRARGRARTRRRARPAGAGR